MSVVTAVSTDAEHLPRSAQSLRSEKTLEVSALTDCSEQNGDGLLNCSTLSVSYESRTVVVSGYLMFLWEFYVPPGSLVVYVEKERRVCV